MNGVALNFGEVDLAASAAAYDPKLHQAPIVVGHPKTDDPAYGWVAGLSVDQDGLQASPEQVDPDFAEMVKAGRFKKISASFYLPDSPANPVPGVYYLRHVGFLGAQAPAVKGLKTASFADCSDASDAGVVEFSEWEDRVEASLWRRLRDFLIGDKGLEVADQVIPDYSVAAIEARANREDEPASIGQLPSNALPYSEVSSPTDSSVNHREVNTVTPEEIAALQAENQRLIAQAAENESRAKADAAARRKAEFNEFIGGLVKEGKVLPVDATALTGVLCHAAGDEVGTAEFGEGDAASPSAWLQSFLGRLPKQVDFSERASETLPSSGTADFAAPAGYSVNPDSLALHNKALEYQEKHPGVDYITAVKTMEKTQ